MSALSDANGGSSQAAMTAQQTPPGPGPPRGRVPRMSQQRSVMVVMEKNPFEAAAAGSATMKVQSLNDCVLISDMQLGVLNAQLLALPSNEERLKLLDVAKLPYLFTSQQLYKLMDLTTSVKTRIAIILAIAPRLVDPRSMHEQFLALFRFVDEKEQVEEALKARHNTMQAALFSRTTPTSSVVPGISGSSGVGAGGRGNAGAGRGGGGRGRGPGVRAAIHSNTSDNNGSKSNERADVVDIHSGTDSDVIKSEQPHVENNAAEVFPGKVRSNSSSTSEQARASSDASEPASNGRIGSSSSAVDAPSSSTANVTPFGGPTRAVSSGASQSPAKSTTTASAPPSSPPIAITPAGSLTSSPASSPSLNKKKSVSATSPSKSSVVVTENPAAAAPPSASLPLSPASANSDVAKSKEEEFVGGTVPGAGGPDAAACCVIM